MTDLKQAAKMALEALEYASTGNRRPEIIGPAITALTAALEQPEPKHMVQSNGRHSPLLTHMMNKRTALEQTEPTQWRDMVVVSLVREGIDKHKARELADHFAAQPEPVAMRMPKVGDKVICLEDESLGEVVSLTAGGSPDITFDDGSRGTYMLGEFAELFGYATAAQQQAEQVGLITPPGPITQYSIPTQRQWVGLTKQDMPSGEDPMFDHQYFIAGMVYAAKVLQEKNT